ncbi:MAG: hypothetical protein ACP5E5_14595 [Acidobacteriaceae bacterium]
MANVDRWMDGARRWVCGLWILFLRRAMRLCFAAALKNEADKGE